jgi:hypothetical protein
VADFTRWWIENYMGWGEFRAPPTFPYPIPNRSREEILAEMNAKLARSKETK